MEEKGIFKILNFFKKLLSGIAISFSCIIILFLLTNTILAQINANNPNYKPIVSLYTIVSPSMTPVIEVYDVVVNVRVNRPENINMGDIITYKSKSSVSEGMTITHRVVGINKQTDGTMTFITQGDNNENPDSAEVSFENIIGKEVLIIPQLGNLQFLLASKKGWIFLILIPIALLIIKDIFKLIDLFGLNNKVNQVITEPDNSKQKLLEEERKEEIKERLGINGTGKPTNVEYNQVLTRKIEEYNTKIAELDKMIIEMEQGKKPEYKKEVKEENYLKGNKIKIVATEENAKKKKNNKQQIVPKQEEKPKKVDELKEDINKLNFGPDYQKEQPKKKKGLFGIEKIK